MRYTPLHALSAEWRPDLSWLVPVADKEQLEKLERLASAGLTHLYAALDENDPIQSCELPVVRAAVQELEPGDVLAVTPGTSKLQVLYRETDIHHTMFLTNRCNSRCLMCSQPPTTKDDSWLVEEAKLIAAHMRRPPDVLGFTGGEPLLLGPALRDVLETFEATHPAASFEVLTNGRLFSDRSLAKLLLTALTARVTWMVPLYGHADVLHDNVVQHEGAFDQTIDGLLTLHAFKQPIQLRIVLIEPVLQVLPELCAFVARNLPFVREVALIACEPIGYAIRNRAVCEVNLTDWTDTLIQSVHRLALAAVPAILMNIPLCAIPSELHRYAQRSISDWKQTYATECDGCQKRDQCCGLFSWAARNWRPAHIKPIREEPGDEKLYGRDSDTDFRTRVSH